jgi:hypothetical protein
MYVYTVYTNCPLHMYHYFSFRIDIRVFVRRSSSVSLRDLWDLNSRSKLVTLYGFTRQQHSLANYNSFWITLLSMPVRGDNNDKCVRGFIPRKISAGVNWIMEWFVLQYAHKNESIRCWRGKLVILGSNNDLVSACFKCCAPFSAWPFSRA